MSDDGFQRAEAQTERMSHRAGRGWFDQMLAGGVSRTHDTVMEVEGSRLTWWRQRRRLRRKYGVVATQISATEWKLRREE